MTKQSSTQAALAEADKLERTLNRLIAAEKRKLKNEDILYLEKNGDIGYESIRTVALPHQPDDAPAESAWEGEAPAEPDSDSHQTSDHQNPPISHLLPNKLPQTPDSQEIGNLIGDSTSLSAPQPDSAAASETSVHVALASAPHLSSLEDQPSPPAGISCHDAQIAGNQADQNAPPDPLQELLGRALAATQVRRGRPSAFDDHAKGQLVALLSVGMSMRQAAAVLGVSHTAVQKILKADPALAEEITAARFQAQLQPLACVIREARRSWKAATWLLKYLDGKIASHEETLEERRQRQQRETDEFLARSTPGVKKRKVHA
jgi:hypothetical protein